MANKYLVPSGAGLGQVEFLVTSTGASDAGKGVATDATGRLDSSVMPVGIGADTSSIIASEALSAGNFVNIYNNACIANARKTDATTSGKEVHGFVLAAVASGASATVYFNGTNTAVTGATPGNVFLATTAGSFTSTAPSGAGNVVQYIGCAVSATAINFVRGIPVTLAS